MVQFPRSSAIAALEGKQRSLKKTKHDLNTTFKVMLVGWVKFYPPKTPKMRNRTKASEELW
jgi:hypothetical protein